MIKKIQPGRNQYQNQNESCLFAIAVVFNLAGVGWGGGQGERGERIFVLKTSKEVSVRTRDVEREPHVHIGCLYLRDCASSRLCLPSSGVCFSLPASSESCPSQSSSSKPFIAQIPFSTHFSFLGLSLTFLNF